MGRIARYAENRTIKRLRIQSWFKAVIHASGLSSGELEYQFSLANEQCPRSCIWDKYRRGDVAPRESLVIAVEERYPGTRFWLSSALWRMADEFSIDMAEIRSAYEGLPKLLRSIFVACHASEATLFWRRPVEAEEVCDQLRRFGTIEAFIAAMIFVREAEVIQSTNEHILALELARQYLDRLSRHPILGGPLNQKLSAYLESRWKDPGYLEIPADSYGNPFGDELQAFLMQGQLLSPRR